MTKCIILTITVFQLPVKSRVLGKATGTPNIKTIQRLYDYIESGATARHIEVNSLPFWEFAWGVLHFYYVFFCVNLSPIEIFQQLSNKKSTCPQLKLLDKLDA